MEDEEELSPRELMALSRRYQRHKHEIKSLILDQLDARKPQVQIAEDFGIERSNIAHFARRQGIYYTKHDRDRRK